MSRETLRKWGLLWRSRNHVDGYREHLLYEQDGRPLMFQTRREVRQFAQEKYGYIKTRQDLRDEPHGWRMPMPVKLITLL